jgi:hypothetical protein
MPKLQLFLLTIAGKGPPSLVDIEGKPMSVTLSGHIDYLGRFLVAPAATNNPLAFGQSTMGDLNLLFQENK